MQPMQRKQIFWLNSTENLWAMSLRSCLRYLLLAYMTWASVWTYAAEPIINGAVNADETLLVTVQGKQATVWEIATGKKRYDVQMPKEGWTYRTSKNAGRIVTAIFDPKGHWLAVAGVANKIYLFDIKSGNLITGINANANFDINSDFITDFCISEDGGFFVSTIQNGFVLWETKENWHPIYYLNNSRESIVTLKCKFIDKNTFFVSVSDGALLLYNTDGEKLGNGRLPNKKFSPYSISISPDKRQFAILFDDKQKNYIGIGSVKKMFINKIMDIGKLSVVDSIRDVVWSSDGKKILAGGKYRSDDSYPVVVWDSVNLNQEILLKGDDNFIQKIIPLKDDGIVVLTTGPSWFVLNKEGKIQQHIYF